MLHNKAQKCFQNCCEVFSRNNLQSLSLLIFSETVAQLNEELLLFPATIFESICLIVNSYRLFKNSSFLLRSLLCSD